MRSHFVLAGLVVLVVGCSPPAMKESTQLHAEATAALASGDKELAVAKLTESIDSEPTTGCLFDRAKLYESMDQDDKALADCNQGLVLQPDHKDLKWLKKQLEKPKAKRFKAPAPRASK